MFCTSHRSSNEKEAHAKEKCRTWYSHIFGAAEREPSSQTHVKDSVFTDIFQAPKYLYLPKEFFPAGESAIEVKVRMIYDQDKGSIIDQYVKFIRVLDSQIRIFGTNRDREAVMETIRICKDREIRKEYLSDREKEVVDILTMLYDDEYILNRHIECKVREAETAKRTAANKLYRKGLTVAEIADAFGCQNKR